MPVYPSGGTIAQSVGSPGFGPAPTPSYNASASVRFNPADTPNFGYVPTVAGNRQTFTISTWVKRSGLSTLQNILTARSGNEATVFRLTTSDTLLYYTQNSTPTPTANYLTLAVFRDVSAWYHMMVSVDTNQSTAADRVKIYVNGVLQTLSTLTAVSQYAPQVINATGYSHAIGFQPTVGEYLNGYLADMNFVDGLALTPSSFTSTDANTGQLVPIQYTGAFGINGFYLPFSSAALAADLGQNPKTTGQDYPYWKNSTLLVDTTNTNGQQNNSFTDSAQFGIGITRNGNTTQGTISPFYLGSGTEQADGYYSGVFDGTGDYLNIPKASTLNGPGDFTFEAWIYPNATASGTLCGFGANVPTGYCGLNWRITTTTMQTYWSTNGTTETLISGGAIQQNVWQHVAATRSGSTIRLFLNGRQVGTGTVSGALYTGSVADGALNSYTIGSYFSSSVAGVFFKGFISNFRYVNGTALYTANFTVPTTPLTVTGNTSLLTCQSSIFSDATGNTSLITPVGQAQPVQNNPFGMTAWSGYFDGTGDYLTFPELNIPASTSFTIEFFVSWNAVPSTLSMFISEDGGSASKYLTYNNNGTLQAQMGGSAATVASCPFSLASNVWYHIAFVRNINTVTIYVNGVAQTMTQATQSGAFLDAGTINYIGRWGGSPEYAFNGQMSNFRAVVGTAVYTSNFTPPTAPLTAISGTQLLTCQSSTFIDNSPSARAITVFGDSYTGTLNNPFGSPVNYTTPPPNGYGLYFNGVNENTYVSVSAPVSFTTTSLETVEFDYFCDDLADHSSTSSVESQSFFQITSGASTVYVTGSVNTSGAIGVSYRNGATSNTIVSGNNVIGAQQWYRIKWQKIGTTMYLYVNNVSVAAPVTITAGALSFTTVWLGRFFYAASSIFNAWCVGKMANFTITQNGATLLDTFRSPYLRDFSTNNYVLTLNGVCSLGPYSPTMPSSLYNATSMGGSAYFDGTGDYLTLANSASLQLGSNTFTVEGWFYFSTFTAVDPLYVLNSASSYAALRLQRDTASTISVYLSNNGSSWANQITNIGSFAASTWNHIAVTRDGTSGVIRVYQNGALIGSATNASALHAGTVNYINAIQSGGTPGIGYSKYISGFRVLIGRNLYPTSFTPPVAPPTNILLTNFLANFTAAGIYDATGNNAIETVGNAQVSTAVKKWGESSMFFDGSGDYLTISNASNSVVFGTSDFTIELWVYFSSFAGNPMVYDARPSGTNGAYVTIYAVTTGVLNLFVNSLDRITSSALSINTWYHVAISRVSSSTRMFINGTQAGATYSDSTNYLNGTGRPFIGLNSNTTTTSYFSGYMQDVRITKGVGRYSGNFTPPAAAFAYNQYDIGNQQWAPTNISVTAGINQDNLVDSPSDYGTDTGLGGQVRGNYCTLSPLSGDTSAVLSNGNLTVTGGTSSGNSRYGTFGVSSGKWYWDYTMTIIGVNGQMAGVTTDITQTTGLTGVKGYYFNGNKYDGATPSAYGATFTTGDVIGVALDMDAGTITFYKNGVSQGVAFSGLTGTYFPLARISAGIQGDFNFGQRAFAYAAPTGFKCLVSTNLPTTNNIGATSSTRADDYFNPVLYTGTGASLGVTGVGFQPDLVWVKGRSGATNHGWYDAVRGVQKQLESNTTTAETTQTTGLTAFGSDGFTVGSLAQLNTSAATYVAWNWKANGAGVANTAGTIPSTVSANTTSGCSIVTYTGTGANATVGHGLGVAPSFITIKQRNGTWSWMTYHANIPVNSYLLLNATDAPATSRPDVYNGAPSSTVINIGNNATINGSGLTYVGYCFAPVSGFSAMGVYTGNGSADGPMIYTGFRPAYVLIKRSSAIESWCLMDSKREGYNVDNDPLFPNLTNAEGTQDFLDLLSNGFKLRSTDTGVNGSGTYIYIAFAEFPFKYSRAR